VSGPEIVYRDDWLSVYQGDCREALRQLPEKSVQTCITSPPYYGLRAYGTAVWQGGDPDCDHSKATSGRGTNVPQTKNPNVDYPVAPHRGGDPGVCGRCGAVRVEPTIWGGEPDHAHEWGTTLVAKRGSGGEREYGSFDGGVGRGPAVSLPSSQMCPCGAWRGALGLEPTPEMYVEHLVEVFAEVRRVLRDDGLLWLNLGDSYANDSKWGGATGGKHADALHGEPVGRTRRYTGLKSKDLIGVPWLVAFALRADGWFLRGDIVWSKPNAMPESVDDRPTRSHEFIFMLAKQAKYFYDGEAVKEPVGEAMIAAARRAPTEPGRTYQHDEATRFGKTSPNRVWSDPEAVQRLLAGRHKRDVWNVATVSYAGAHYATFPPTLVEPMIKAGSPERGCCAVCGAPWVRAIEVRGVTTAKGGAPHQAEYGRLMHGLDDLSGEGSTGSGFAIIERETVGWQPNCVHEGEPVPAVVLDPFGGSGTVGMVAQQLGRRAVLIDLNPQYVEQQMVRNAQVPLGLIT
jgi:DNA modification methylase